MVEDGGGLVARQRQGFVLKVANAVLGPIRRAALPSRVRLRLEHLRD
jgi:hypothetical protein